MDPCWGPHLNREDSHSFRIHAARDETKAETDVAQALFNGLRMEKWECVLEELLPNMAQLWTMAGGKGII